MFFLALSNLGVCSLDYFQLAVTRSYHVTLRHLRGVHLAGCHDTPCC